jgi:toxin ParE1/3/4
MRILFLPAARQDILEQFLYLQQAGFIDAAEHFVDSIRQSVEQIRDLPEIGSPRKSKDPLLKGIRRWPVRRFSMIGIYYCVTEQELVIIRILHERRNVANILKGPFRL